MNDNDLMPWGSHRGKPIGEVPFDYLLKYYRKGWIDGDVLIYFERCLAVLEEQEIELNFKNPQKAKKYLIDNYECIYPHKKINDRRDLNKKVS